MFEKIPRRKKILRGGWKVEPFVCFQAKKSEEFLCRKKFRYGVDILIKYDKDEGVFMPRIFDRVGSCKSFVEFFLSFLEFLLAERKIYAKLRAVSILKRMSKLKRHTISSSSSSPRSLFPFQSGTTRTNAKAKAK